MSGLPYIERDINGTTYRAHTLMLGDWADLTELLAGTLGGPVADLLRGDTVRPPGADPAMSRFEVEGTIASVATAVTARSLNALAGSMAKSLHSDGRPLTTEKQRMYWPGHMRDLAPAVKLFLEAQYSDFFEGLSDSMPSELSGNEDSEKESG